MALDDDDVSTDKLGIDVWPVTASLAFIDAE